MVYAFGGGPVLFGGCPGWTVINLAFQLRLLASVGPCVCVFGFPSVLVAPPDDLCLRLILSTRVRWQRDIEYRRGALVV